MVIVTGAPASPGASSLWKEDTRAELRENNKFGVVIFVYSSAMERIMKKHPFQYVLGTCSELKGIWFTSILEQPRIKSVGGSNKISPFFFFFFFPRTFPKYPFRKSTQ